MNELLGCFKRKIMKADIKFLSTVIPATTFSYILYHGLHSLTERVKHYCSSNSPLFYSQHIAPSPITVHYVYK